MAIVVGNAFCVNGAVCVFFDVVPGRTGGLALGFLWCCTAAGVGAVGWLAPDAAIGDFAEREFACFSSTCCASASDFASGICFVLVSSVASVTS